MIICRTPFRVSFFGGGTDYPIWYRENSGAVISATINKYSYITARRLPPFFDFKHRIRYFEKEETQTIHEIRHPSVRECARYLEFDDAFELVHTADLPARSGLGSSSTFTVGALHAFHSLKNYMPTKRELALQALHVEQERIGEAVGSQDQVAAAFGGLNLIRFAGVREFDVDPIVIAPERLQRLQENLLLCFTGYARTASDIARSQIELTPTKLSELRAMSDICNTALECLTAREDALDEFGRLLNEQWRIKRGLSHLVSTPKIDEIYEAGLKCGALGGKLLGAGGGGFMLFYAPKECHANIQAVLNERMFVPFRFEFTGSKIVYFSRD
ncbi:MAG: kinase [Candidatus Sericytochromatia bacterium]|nr:kinase [Candidatus Sericytochromatia bacterium]